MTDDTETIEDEVSREIEIDGIMLEIYAHRVGEEQWALCVINELGIISHLPLPMEVESLGIGNC